jgi:hypothetical protein
MSRSRTPRYLDGRGDFFYKVPYDRLDGIPDHRPSRSKSTIHNKYHEPEPRYRDLSRPWSQPPRYFDEPRYTHSPVRRERTHHSNSPRGVSGDGRGRSHTRHGFEDDYRPSRSENHKASRSQGRGYRDTSLDRPRYRGMSPKPSASRTKSMPAKSKSTSKGKHSSRSVGNEVLGTAVKTALHTGAATAWGMRNDPGPWLGEKGTKVATAALGAALVDTFMTKKHPQKVGGKRHGAMRQVAEVALNRGVVQSVAKGARRHH